MKKIIALLLAVITVFSMAACGKKPKEPANPTTEPMVTWDPTDSDIVPTNPTTDEGTTDATVNTASSASKPSRPAPASRATKTTKATKATDANKTTKPTSGNTTTTTSATTTPSFNTQATKPTSNTQATKLTSNTQTTKPSSKETTATAANTNPTKPVQAKYDSSEDAPFLPKDIFSNDLYVPGIVLGQSGQSTLDVTNQSNVGAFVVKGEYGKCYEVKIPAGVPCAVAARFSTDPRNISVGAQITYTSDMSVKSAVQRPSKEISFMYNCRTYGEYLVIYTGSSSPIYIGERTIIQQTDTQGPWYIPESVGSINGSKTLGDVNWTSEQFFNNLYEPLREKYPNYITRSSIGKDATGKYDMYCYVYEPENYKTTIFLNGGTHGDEEVGYFALAKVMQLIADATPEDVLLYELRQKVRFVVIPIVNVWSVSNSHTRTNGKGTDLNRDYENLTQQESKNVMACFDKYAEDVSVVMDFHIANASPVDVALYFNFINYADNAVANYKTTNHMYHRYKELGHAGNYTDLSRVPGSYTKGNQYFEGRIWNQYGVPTITVEYLTTKNFPMEFSDKCMTLAVETYMNFIIQNALFYIQAK